jgi:hypothetical protein
MFLFKDPVFDEISNESIFDRFRTLDVIENQDIIEIVGWNTNAFTHYIEKRYKTSRIANHMFIFVDRWILRFNKFFAIEVLYLLNECYEPTARNRYQGNRSTLIEVIKKLESNTWLKQLNDKHTPDIDFNKLKNLKITLKDYQLEFIKDIYIQKKERFDLNGYLLAYEQGLGKSITAISLMYLINKQKTIIICPKSTIDNVWYNEISKIFGDNHKFKIWTSNLNTPATMEYDYYILNYEF